MKKNSHSAGYFQPILLIFLTVAVIAGAFFGIQALADKALKTADGGWADEAAEKIVQASAKTAAETEAATEAVEKAEGETHILVDLQYRGDVLVISVKDNGAGMSTVTLQQLQSRLDNCESEKNTEFQTSGIGLINIQKRIRFQFGSPYGITLSSEEGSGTTVTLSIPRSVKPC